MIAAAFRLLRPGGVFVGFFPNGSDNYRKANFTGWQSSWGKVHPSLLDDRYFDAALKGRTGILATTPVDISKSQLAAIGRQSGKLVRNDPLDRPELFVLAMN